jgi:hypothetical protein
MILQMSQDILRREDIHMYICVHYLNPNTRTLVLEVFVVYAPTCVIQLFLILTLWVD